MYSHIVIGIDGSAASRSALIWGMKRAREYNGSVELMHVIDDSFLSDIPVFLSEARRAADVLMENELALARSCDPDIECKTTIVVGHPAHEFQEASKRATLMVFGSHAGHGLPLSLFGSREIKYAAVSKCPAVLIPLSDDVERNGVVVGIDTTPQSDIPLQLAAKIADRVKTDLTVVYAWTAPVTPGLEYLWSDQLLATHEDGAKRAMEQAVASIVEQYPNLVIHRQVVQQAPVPALVSAGKTARLIVVGNRGRSRLVNILLGSVSHGIVQHVPCPTLIVHTDTPQEDLVAP